MVVGEECPYCGGIRMQRYGICERTCSPKEVPALQSAFELHKKQDNTIQLLEKEIEKRNEIILELIYRFNPLRYNEILDRKGGKEEIDRLHKLYVKMHQYDSDLEILEGWKKEKKKRKRNK